MRRAARIDDNQPAIATALRQCGVSIEYIHRLGKGVPDILCGWHRVNTLFEIKDGLKSPSERRLTPDEQRWHRDWRGQVAIVESFDEAWEILQRLARK